MQETVTAREAVVISILVKPETKKRLEMYADLIGTSMSSVARWAIEEYLDRQLQRKEA